jgi:hypothetical protein
MKTRDLPLKTWSMTIPSQRQHHRLLQTGPNPEYLTSTAIRHQVLKSHLERVRLSQVTLKAPILEWHIRRAEISVRQRRTRSSRKTFPSNKRLLPTTRTRETQPRIKRESQPNASQITPSRRRQNSLMVNRPSTEIPNQQPSRSPIQIRRRRRVEIAVRRSRSSDDFGGGALRREPDDGILPVVAVAEAG